MSRISLAIHLHVITDSLETMKIVRSLPKLDIQELEPYFMVRLFFTLVG